MCMNGPRQLQVSPVVLANVFLQARNAGAKLHPCTNRPEAANHTFASIRRRLSERSCSMNLLASETCRRCSVRILLEVSVIASLSIFPYSLATDFARFCGDAVSCAEQQGRRGAVEVSIACEARSPSSKHGVDQIDQNNSRRLSIGGGSGGGGVVRAPSIV